MSNDRAASLTNKEPWSFFTCQEHNMQFCQALNVCRSESNISERFWKAPAFRNLNAAQQNARDTCSTTSLFLVYLHKVVKPMLKLYTHQLLANTKGKANGIHACWIPSPRVSGLAVFRQIHLSSASPEIPRGVLGSCQGSHSIQTLPSYLSLSSLPTKK